MSNTDLLLIAVAVYAGCFFGVGCGILLSSLLVHRMDRKRRELREGKPSEKKNTWSK